MVLMLYHAEPAPAIRFCVTARVLPCLARRPVVYTVPMTSRRKRRQFSLKKSSAGGPLWRRWLIRLAAAAALLLILVVIGYYQLLSYLQGDSFRARMEEGLAERLQADSFSIPSNLAIDGAHLRLDAATMQRDDALSRLELREIAADIRRWPLLDRCLHVLDLQLGHGRLDLDLASAFKATPSREEEEGFWESFSPDHVVVEKLSCADTQLELRAGSLSILSLSGSEVTATPVSPGRTDGWTIHFAGGTLETPWDLLRQAEVESAALETQAGGLRMSRTTLRLTPGEGILHAEGRLGGQHRWSLKVQASRVGLERLISERWSRHLSGTLSGHLELSGRGMQLLKAEGMLSLHHATLSDLPVLAELPLPGAERYKRLGLQKAVCRVRYPYNEPSHMVKNAWIFDRIDVRTQGDNLRLAGRVIVCEDGSLRGTLRLGLPDSFLSPLTAVIPETVNDIFNAEGDEGFRWLTINLSGTLSSPQEDLSARLREKLPDVGTLKSAAKQGAELTSQVATSISSLLSSPKGAEPAPRGADAEKDGEPSEPSDADKPTPPSSLPGRLLHEAGETADGLLNGWL